MGFVLSKLSKRKHASTECTTMAKSTTSITKVKLEDIATIPKEEETPTNQKEAYNNLGKRCDNPIDSPDDNPTKPEIEEGQAVEAVAENKNSDGICESYSLVGESKREEESEGEDKEHLKQKHEKYEYEYKDEEEEVMKPMERPSKRSRRNTYMVLESDDETYPLELRVGNVAEYAMNRDALVHDSPLEWKCNLELSLGELPILSL